MKRNSNYWDIITKDLSGRTSPEEDLWIKEWKSNPENEQLYNSIESIRLDFNNDDAIRVKDQVLGKTFNKIFSSQEQKTNKSFRKLHLWSIAAGLAILFGVTSLFMLYKNINTDSPLVILSCPSGISTVLLPDGSTVTLNAKSTLKFPANFDKESRKVILEGEAFFDVKKDNSRPFIVTAGSMDFKVLGTTFNISAYPHDKETIASLLSGSIELKDNFHQRSLVLHPNQGVTFNKETTELALKAIEPEYVTGWLKGELLFKKLPFSTVCNMLERKFGYNIEIKKPELEAKLFTGKFVNRETLPQILEIIKINESFSYTIQENNVVIF